MSQALHLVSGSGLMEGKCLPGSGVPGRTVALNPCSSNFSHRFNSQLNVGPLRCASARKASSNNGYNRRNPDFSRQNRHGFSRSRNKPPNDDRDRDRDRDRDGFDSIDDSELLSSKNGPYLSLSSSPKFQATAAPGPREKEIVELFRKVQAQLRERAAAKDDKRSEALPGQGKESETVDSLLKLLRKHSTEQSKRSGGRVVSSREFVYDQPGQNGQYGRAKTRNPNSLTSNNTANVAKEQARDSAPSFSRPVSNFQRKSPVSRLKFQPVYPDERKNHDEVVDLPEMGLEELELGSESESESELEAEAELVGEEAMMDEEDDVAEEEVAEEPDLSGWKLAELRALAKSRGVKGYSKMKKGDLVDLLSGSSA